MNAERDLVLESQEVSTSKAVYWKIAGSFLLFSILGAALYLSSDLDWDSVIRNVRGLAPSTVLLLVALAVLQVAGQAGRLWVLLPRKLDIPFLESFRIFSVGQVVNQLLPARAGDVLKVSWIKRAGVSAAELVGSVFVADKIADISSLLICVAVLSPSLLGEINISAPFASLLTLEAEEVLGASGVLAILAYFLGRPLYGRIKGLWTGVANGARSLLEPKRMSLALSLGIGTWLLEAGVIQQLSGAAGHPLLLSQSMLVLAILNIGIAVPVTFANLGAFEGAMAFGLSRFDVPLPMALAIGGVYHGIQLSAVLLPAGIGTLAHNLASTRLKRKLQTQDKRRALEYYEARSSQYTTIVSAGPLAWFRERERAAILRWMALEEQPERSMLDAGCGDGKYALIAKKTGLKVHAMDLSPGMVARLRGQVDHAWVGDLESLDASTQYDVVLCSGVLDFVLDPKAAFDRLCQSVAPGGRLVVLVPRQGPFGLIYRIEKAVSGFRVNLFSQRELGEWALQHGLVSKGASRPLPTNMVLCFEQPAPQRTDTTRYSRSPNRTESPVFLPSS